MFLGHFAVAFAAKKAAPKVSLGTMFMASQLVDLLWPLFLLLGLEHMRIVEGTTPFLRFDFYDYPLTHSLAGALIWSLVMGAIYFAIRKKRREATFVGLAVFSHWVLDFISHRPDLPLWISGGSAFGLGLWYSAAATMTVEIGLYAVGIIIYLQTTTTRDRIGSYGFWSLIGLLLAIYLASVFGPPPNDVQSVAVAGNLSWLFVPLAYWVDRHRIFRHGSVRETAAGEQY